ncbi:MAG: hypothetical protein LBC86_10385 [Oscillospiraceae bacterium]|jgi:hypothetical protein|nr:hypothetical protein [Oscillospiraceae bacterium]
MNNENTKTKTRKKKADILPEAEVAVAAGEVVDTTNCGNTAGNYMSAETILAYQ